MLRAIVSVAIDLVLGTLAMFPMFVSAAGHDSRSVFVPIANSAVLQWPFLLAARFVPTSASGSVGLSIHYAFYVLVAWLLVSLWHRRASRMA